MGLDSLSVALDQRSTSDRSLPFQNPVGYSNLVQTFPAHIQVPLEQLRVPLHGLSIGLLVRVCEQSCLLLLRQARRMGAPALGNELSLACSPPGIQACLLSPLLWCAQRSRTGPTRLLLFSPWLTSQSPARFAGQRPCPGHDYMHETS